MWAACVCYGFGFGFGFRYRYKYRFGYSVRTVRAKPVPGKIKSCADVADSAAAAPLTKLKFWVWESGGGGWKLRGAGGLATKSAKVHKSKVFEIGAQGEN